MRQATAVGNLEETEWKAREKNFNTKIALSLGAWDMPRAGSMLRLNAKLYTGLSSTPTLFFCNPTVQMYIETSS